MGQDSRIEWTDHTFNPWTGCTKVSEGCANCYAEGWAKRSGLVQWGPKGERRLTSASNWKLPEKWDRQAAAAGRRAKVFCASLADVFEDTPDHTGMVGRTYLWSLIKRTPHLDWLLLTKRPENIRSMLPEDWGNGWGNVWLGTTVENQKQADSRIPHLLAAPAAVRFLSCEPLLEEVDVSRWLLIDWQCQGCKGFFRGRHREICPDCGREGFWSGSHDFNGRGMKPHPVVPPQGGRGIDWIIAGGESGSKARPMHPDWARGLRDQCAAAGVPFLFKQWGEWAPGRLLPKKRGDKVKRFAERWSDRWYITSWPNGCFFEMTMIGKKAAGRLLDGKVHDGMPGAKS